MSCNIAKYNCARISYDGQLQGFRMMGSYAEYPTTNFQNEGRGGALAWNVPYGRPDKAFNLSTYGLASCAGNIFINKCGVILLKPIATVT